jgi:hypothetical protein
MGVAGAQTVDQLWKMLEEVEARRGSEGAAGESDAQDEVPRIPPALGSNRALGTCYYQILNSVAG